MLVLMRNKKKIKQKSREIQESKLSVAYLEAELWNKEREKDKREMFKDKYEFKKKKHKKKHVKEERASKWYARR